MHHTNYQKRIRLTFVNDYFDIKKLGRKGNIYVQNSL